MRKRRQVPWYRSPAVWVVAAVVVAGIVAVLMWPRAPVYAQYTDGIRPTVVFVWSDPTPHHPYG